MEHIPVLLKPILQAAIDGELSPPHFLLDGTFGRGGHTRALMNEFPTLRVFGLDHDEDAILYGQDNFREDIQMGRLALMRANFSQLDIWQEKAKEFHGGHGFDLILLDLGVSSPQLDQAERGFSFYTDGPLDMRMDKRSELTAAGIVNTWQEEELGELFRLRGEVHRPRRVVSAILNFRREHNFSTTRELASLIEKVEGWRHRGHHPATQYFMALRLEVNRELESIQEVIPHLIDVLVDHGRLLIISFHSLEDRIVKYSFRNNLERGSLVNKKVIQADRIEAKKNPRSRSAKLRIFEKNLYKLKGRKYEAKRSM